MNRFKLTTLPAGILVEDKSSGLRAMYNHDGTWRHGDLSATLADDVVRRHLAAVNASTLDNMQRHMASEVGRAARAFGLSFTDREMVFILALATEVDQMHYQHPHLSVEEVVAYAASSMAAKA